jgi:hypothetical protein
MKARGVKNETPASARLLSQKWLESRADAGVYLVGSATTPPPFVVSLSNHGRAAEDQTSQYIPCFYTLSTNGVSFAD